jgi:mRNA-degrading endonuclease RelE of RelBE toxin-antitoxin system
MSYIVKFSKKAAKKYEKLPPTIKTRILTRNLHIYRLLLEVATQRN